MQWDGTKNAGFSSAEKTWLPVHGNYKEINVEKASREEDSLLNVIRALVKLRREFISLREGSLELMNDLPNNVLGYKKISGKEKIIILLNFDRQTGNVSLKNAECVFQTSKSRHNQMTQTYA